MFQLGGGGRSYMLYQNVFILLVVSLPLGKSYAPLGSTRPDACDVRAYECPSHSYCSAMDGSGNVGRCRCART